MTTSEKIALVTGASSGIGRALAVELQQRGYRVYATARKTDDLHALTAAGFQALPLDVNDQHAIDQMSLANNQAAHMSLKFLQLFSDCH